jgi:hypothetical protein
MKSTTSEGGLPSESPLDVRNEMGDSTVTVGGAGINRGELRSENGKLKSRQQYPLKAPLTEPLEEPLIEPLTTPTCDFSPKEDIGIPSQVAVNQIPEPGIQTMPYEPWPDEPLDEDEIDLLGRLYSLPRAVAKDLGINEAVVLAFLAHKTRTSKNVRQGRHWYYETAKNLASQRFPWISPTTLGVVICRLERAGKVHTACHNKHGYDRTKWYSVPDDVIEEVAKNRIYFRVEDAVEHGVEAALLLHNLRYHLGEQKKRGAADPWWPMRPTELARHLPISKATIGRLLNRLCWDGSLERRWNALERASEYRIDTLDEYRHPIGGEWEEGAQPTVCLPAPQQDVAEQPVPSGCAKELLSRADQILFDGGYEAAVPRAQRIAQLVDEWLPGAPWFFISENPKSGSADHLCTRLLQTLSLDSPTPNNIQVLFIAFLLQAVGSYDLDYLPTPRWEGQLNELVRQRSYAIGRLRTAYKIQWAQRHLDERAKQYRSPDHDIEDDSEQPAAAKARILRNSLNAARKIGYLDKNGDHISPEISFTLADIRAAEIFFEHNPTTTPRNLARLIQECASLPRDPDESAYDEMFHARKSRNLKFLLIHAAEAVQQLGLEADFPALRPVSKEVLYPPPNRTTFTAP